MSYEDAFLTKDFEAFLGGKFVAGTTDEEADELTFTTAALFNTAGQTHLGTPDVATKNGWTKVSTDGWGFVAGNYSGPTTELVEQDGASEAVFRQSLEVVDLTWNFQIDVNDETLKIFGGITQKRRRLIVAPNGTKAGASVDQFVAWVSAPTQDNRGRQQYNVTVSLNGPVKTHTLT